MTTFTSRFAENAYRPTFTRSLRSELTKLNTRTVQVTALIGVALYGLIMWLVATSAAEETDPRIAVIGWSSLTFFFIIIGAVAATSEYAHNTMRTTALSDPRRPRSYTAKLAAVTIISAVLSVALLGVGLAILSLRMDGFHISGEGLEAYFAFVVLMTAIGVLSAAMGYLVRSTAGAIAVMIGFIYLLDLVRLIPQRFFQETVSQLIPSSLGNVAITGQAPTDALVSSPWAALAIFVGYAAIGVVVGLLSFTKRDI